MIKKKRERSQPKKEPVRPIRKIRLEDWRIGSKEHSVVGEREGKNIIDKKYKLNEFAAQWLNKV